MVELRMKHTRVNFVLPVALLSTTVTISQMSLSKFNLKIQFLGRTGHISNSQEPSVTNDSHILEHRVKQTFPWSQNVPLDDTTL